jgi:hypothetical protein
MLAAAPIRPNRNVYCLPISGTCQDRLTIGFQEVGLSHRMTKMVAIKSVRPGRLSFGRMVCRGAERRSNLARRRQRQRILGIDAGIPNRALQLRMAKQDLHGPQVARPLVDERDLGPAQAVGAVS